MLSALGLTKPEDLFRDIPAGVRLSRPLRLAPGLTEMEVLGHLQGLAGANDGARHTCFLGGGAYDHYVPAAVPSLASRGEFATSYTPYQPEVSQGTLQAIYEFQSMVCALYGLDVANASVYDGATALGEAALLAARATGRRRLLVSRAMHPAHRQVLATYANGSGLLVDEIPVAGGHTDLLALKERLGADVAAVLLQEPNYFGLLEPVEGAGALAHEAGALYVVSADPLSLGLLNPPGSYGADVAVGEGQPLGVGLHFGGPYVGLLAVREALMRQVPGRIVGATVDDRGRRGFVLTLQAREQHIRRERATSNICTNQALVALRTTIYLSLLGREGLRQVATLCLEKAAYAARRLAAVPGYSLAFEGPFFREFVLRCPRPAEEVAAALAEEGFLVGPGLGRHHPELSDCLLVAVTEQRSRQEIDRLAAWLLAVTERVKA